MRKHTKNQKRNKIKYFEKCFILAGMAKHKLLSKKHGAWFHVNPCSKCKFSELVKYSALLFKHWTNKY